MRHFTGSNRRHSLYNKKKYLAACLAVAGILALTGCGSASSDGGAEEGTTAAQEEAADTASDEPVSTEIFAMDTYMTLTAYGENAQAGLDAAAAEITRLENLLSTGVETSEVAVLNAQGENTVSEETSYLIGRSMDLYTETDGCFDITVYPVMEAWGFTTQDYRVPGEEELSELLTHMGADKVSLDADAGTVSLAEGTKIDLGGIAKGYTSGRVMDIFEENGVESAIISLGGNVQAEGCKPDGSKWRVGVQDPSDTSSYIGVLEVEDKAVITSGGYERYFEEDGKTYHHIIDPDTGYPADTDLTSVTIVSDDGTLADGLSTSLFIMGSEKAQEFWKNSGEDFDVILVTEEGKILVSEGIADDFTAESDWETVSR